MARQDSYENSLAVIERSRNERKSNERILAEMAKIRKHEIDTIADVKRKEIDADVEKQRIQRESMLR